MNFFKGFGYVTTAHALSFANDLKLGHYLKIPPRQTFWCQVAASTYFILYFFTWYILQTL